MQARSCTHTDKHIQHRLWAITCSLAAIMKLSMKCCLGLKTTTTTTTHNFLCFVISFFHRQTRHIMLVYFVRQSKSYGLNSWKTTGTYTTCILPVWHHADKDTVQDSQRTSKQLPADLLRVHPTAKWPQGRTQGSLHPIWFGKHLSIPSQRKQAVWITFAFTLISPTVQITKKQMNRHASSRWCSFAVQFWAMMTTSSSLQK